MVALASGIGAGIVHFFGPLVGFALAWTAVLALPAAVAFGLMRRMQRRIGRLNAIVAEAQSLFAGVHGPGGDHILRIDDNGLVSADLSASFGNPLRIKRPLVGLPFAALCNSDGYLVEPATDCEDAQTFAVRMSPQKRGNLAILRDVTSQQKMVQRLGHAATLDALTGLPNRQSFLHALETVCTSGQGGFVVLFDIDKLKAINERHGEAVGDAVLRAFVSDATELVRGGDNLSRIGDGSFAAILSTADCLAAEMIASRLISRFSGTTRTFENAIVRASASAGIAPVSELVTDTIRDAEHALIAAKARENDRFEMAAGRLRA
ncbi:GGDEF domain-containing protein [Novosphingobium sp.]|uniref:GGDEF domain-containing protein n=1 Tax=Novosphingobium sp. TaxID=1874826 RepID=UPI003B51F6ED